MSEALIRRFERFHAANPHVYRLFIELTQQTIARQKKVSAAFIIERIRWEIVMGTKTEDGFKINADYSAFYARLFMKDFPKHIGYFHLRISVADNWIRSLPF